MARLRRFTRHPRQSIIHLPIMPRHIVLQRSWLSRRPSILVMVRDIMVVGTGMEGIDILITIITTMVIAMTIEAAGATREAGTDKTINHQIRKTRGSRNESFGFFVFS